YERKLQDVEDTGRAAGKSDAEIERLKAMILSPEQEQVVERQKKILAEQVRMMTGVRFAAEDMFASFLDGSKSASEAFADFGQNLRRIASQVLAERAIQALLGMFGGMFGAKTPTPSFASGFGNNTDWLTNG